MNILVTGAAGFIGSYTAQMLLERGDTVVGLDNFNDYYDPAKKRANAKRLGQYENFKMVEGDIRNREAVLDLFRAENFDVVAHIAAMAGVHSSAMNPALYVEVDFNGTQHLMDAARESEVGNFVMASTSSVYGDTDQLPFIETDPCVRPPQPYAAAKRASELLGYTYNRLYDFNFTAVRFFTVYGPNGRPDMMPYLLAESIYKGRKIPLHEGDIRRDWTFVEDTARGVIAALDKPLGFEILNLGRGEPLSLAEFIETMERVAGKKANLEPQPRPAAYMLATYADITKAKDLLGFNPTVSVQEGVERFWAWYVSEQESLVGA